MDRGIPLTKPRMKILRTRHLRIQVPRSALATKHRQEIRSPGTFRTRLILYIGNLSWRISSCSSFIEKSASHCWSSSAWRIPFHYRRSSFCRRKGRASGVESRPRGSSFMCLLNLACRVMSVVPDTISFLGQKVWNPVVLTFFCI